MSQQKKLNLVKFDFLDFNFLLNNLNLFGFNSWIKKYFYFMFNQAFKYALLLYDSFIMCGKVRFDFFFNFLVDVIIFNLKYNNFFHKATFI